MLKNDLSWDTSFAGVSQGSIVLHNLPSCLVVLRTRLRPGTNPIEADGKEPMPAHPRELRKECRHRRVRVALGRELAAAAKDQQQLG